MKSTWKIGGGLAAACAACCAVSIVPALVAGTSLAAIGGTIAWELGLVVLAGLAVAGLYLILRRRPATTMNPARPEAAGSVASEGCGCGPSCASTKRDEAPIACTLETGDFKERTASIRDLARRSLRHASRAPLTLTLTYAAEALDEVQDLVAMERRCCAFLDFDLRNDGRSVVLIITAPESARDAADIIFDHFAPELASEVDPTPRLAVPARI